MPTKNTSSAKGASADEFVTALQGYLSPLVHSDRHVNANFKSSKGFTSHPGQSRLAINFYNLPTSRVKERRGGGAEAENNRALFMVHGFETDSKIPVAKVKLEQLVNVIGSPDRWAPNMRRWAPNMRAKSGDPLTVAKYLANYINDVASTFPPQFSHE